MESDETKQKTVVLQDEGLRKLKGFVQIPKLVLLYKNLSYGAKVAYGILLGYAWQDEFCFPAQKAIAEDLGCSIRQAQRFLDELKKEKLITWTQRGMNQPNIYYILQLPKIEQMALKNKDTTNLSRPDTTNLSRPDTTNLSRPDTTNLSRPDTTNLSGQEATDMSYYKYSYNNNHTNVNVDKEGKGRGGMEEPKIDLHRLPNLGEPPEKTEYIANDILAVLGDANSKPFYRLVAAKIPESFIRKKLSEIKQGNAHSPARVFVSIVKTYAAEKLAKQKIQGITAAKEGLFRIGNSQLQT